MIYATVMDCLKLGEPCYNLFVNPYNLCDDEYTCFLYRNPVQCIELHIRQPPFQEYMLHAAAKEFNDAEKHIYSAVKSIDWWLNKTIH